MHLDGHSTIGDNDGMKKERRVDNTQVRTARSVRSRLLGAA